jgi:hypothetical protein
VSGQPQCHCTTVSSDPERCFVSLCRDVLSYYREKAHSRAGNRATKSTAVCVSRSVGCERVVALRLSSLLEPYFYTFSVDSGGAFLPRQVSQAPSLTTHSTRRAAKLRCAPFDAPACRMKCSPTATTSVESSSTKRTCPLRESPKSQWLWEAARCGCIAGG